MKPDIKIICFDLNKTLIKENTWLNLNLAMGMTKEEDDFLFQLFEEKIISYNEWQDLITRIYKNRGKATLENITRAVSSYSYMRGAKEIIKYLKTKGYEIVIISGAMDILIDQVAKELDIHLFEAGNIFIFDTNDYLENIISLGEDNLVKLRHLESFCRRLNCKQTECVCVGDGDNDKELFNRTGHGITFKGSKLESIAWKTINNLLDLEHIF